MNNYDKYFFAFLLLISSHSFSQTNISVDKFGAAKNIICYKETMISPMQSIVLTSNTSATQLLQVNNNGELNTNFQFPPISKDEIVTASNKILWVVGKNSMAAYSFNTKKKIATHTIPPNANFTAAVVGFDNTLFCLDANKNQIYRWNNGTWTMLFESADISNANCILLNGPSLYIGTNSAIKVLHIGNTKLSTIADNMPNVKTMSLDYFGNLVVLTNDFIARYTLDGGKTILPKDAKDAITLAVNTFSNKLLLINKANEIQVEDYLKLIGESTNTMAMKNNIPMKPFATKDMILVGSEFLYHTMDEKGVQKEEVNDGFYPELGVYIDGEKGTFTPNEKVMDCAKKSYAAFKKWAANLPPAFMATTKNTPPMFWLMVNDYSSIKATLTDKKREAALWYWKRNPAVIGRVPGYWKWEATLTQDCKCEIPNEVAAIKCLEAFIKK
jgi:hypothetical protein